VVDLRLSDVDVCAVVCGGWGRLSGVRVVGATHEEVDEHDRGRPVEVREALVSEVDHVERDGHEHTVEDQGAARGVGPRATHTLAVDEAAAAVAGAAAERRRERHDLEDLTAKANREQQREDKEHVRVVELELHVVSVDVLKQSGDTQINAPQY
jgi:hypothetical protein